MSIEEIEMSIVGLIEMIKVRNNYKFKNNGH